MQGIAGVMARFVSRLAAASADHSKDARRARPAVSVVAEHPVVVYGSAGNGRDRTRSSVGTGDTLSGARLRVPAVHGRVTRRRGLKSGLMPKVVLILVAIVTLPWVNGCSDSSAQQGGEAKQAGKPVKTEAVRQESVRRSLDVVGTLAAEDQVTVSSEVDGVVRRIRADLGDRVTAGQPLV